MLSFEGSSIYISDYGRGNMPESWKEPEEDNMSIGELVEWLQNLPTAMQHLPVNVLCGELRVSVNLKRLAFTDGERYYSSGALQFRQVFSDIYLEIDTGNHI
jgi:hypothetical protein